MPTRVTISIEKTLKVILCCISIWYKGNVGLTPGKTGTLTDRKTTSALQLLVTTNSKMNHVLESHTIKGGITIFASDLKKLSNVY